MMVLETIGRDEEEWMKKIRRRRWRKSVERYSHIPHWMLMIIIWTLCIFSIIRFLLCEFVWVVQTIFSIASWTFFSRSFACSNQWNRFSSFTFIWNIINGTAHTHTHRFDTNKAIFSTELWGTYHTCTAHTLAHPVNIAKTRRKKKRKNPKLEYLKLNYMACGFIEIGILVPCLNRWPRLPIKRANILAKQSTRLLHRFNRHRWIIAASCASPWISPALRDKRTEGKGRGVATDTGKQFTNFTRMFNMQFIFGIWNVFFLRSIKEL